MSIRDLKRQQMKHTQAKIEAKDTRTKKIYAHCLKLVAKENERIKRENQQFIKDSEVVPIKNLFKMARVEVNLEKEKKEKEEAAKALNKDFSQGQ